MTQPLMPSPSVDPRLKFEALGLQFEEVIARFDEEIRKQKLKRIQKSLSLIDNNSDRL